MSLQFHPLTVLETREEIGGEAKTVMFDVAEPLSEQFAWRAGQHLSLRFHLNGQEVRRSYSISSSPQSGDPLQITVKRVKGGLVSNHINDVVASGDTIDVMPPFGSFCLDAASNLRRTHYFFAAGSGITPIYSMLHTVLCSEPHSVAYLLYGNKSAGNIIFHDALNRLTEAYPDRLGVYHVLSAPSLWSQMKYWRKGKIDAAAIAELIDQNPPYAQDTQYYICGPGNMNQTVSDILRSHDVPATRIHTESYGGAATVDDTVAGVDATAEIMLEGQSHQLSINNDQTVLQAVTAAGLNPPYSCQSGVCGACKARLTEGSVHMRATMALDHSDIEAGDILTCQSIPTSDHLSLKYS